MSVFIKVKCPLDKDASARSITMFYHYTVLIKDHTNVLMTVYT